MEKVNTQEEKGICICRKDTSIAVSHQDKKIIEDLRVKRKDPSIKDTLHHVISQFVGAAKA